MLELTNIVLKAGAKNLFSIDSIFLDKGVIALVGRNGSGKSTFIRMLLGEHTDYEGVVQYGQKKLTDYSVIERSKLLSVVYSKPHIFGNHQVGDVLMLGRLPHQSLFSKPTNTDIEKVAWVLELLKINNWEKKTFQVLSDGEKQLVMIGRALVQDTPLILMDEPAAFLDVVNRYELSVLLKKIADETGKLIICSTHQLDRIEQDCDGLLLIAQNRMNYLSQPAAFMKSIHQAFDMV